MPPNGTPSGGRSVISIPGFSWSQLKLVVSRCMDERRSRSAKPFRLANEGWSTEEPFDHPISSGKDYLSSSRLHALYFMLFAPSPISGPKYCDVTDNDREDRAGQPSGIEYFLI